MIKNVRFPSFHFLSQGAKGSVCHQKRIDFLLLEGGGPDTGHWLIQIDRQMSTIFYSLSKWSDFLICLFRSHSGFTLFITPRSNLILPGFLAFSKALSTFQSLSITFFPVWIFRLIPCSPHLTTLSDKRGRQNDFKWKTTEMCCFCCFYFFYSAFFYTLHICLFIFQCLSSSLTVSCWSDTLESDPRDTRFCISWPPNHSWWVFWMDWSHKLFLESVRKKE